LGGDGRWQPVRLPRLSHQPAGLRPPGGGPPTREDAGGRAEMAPGPPEPETRRGFPLHTMLQGLCAKVVRVSDGIVAGRVRGELPVARALQKGRDPDGLVRPPAAATLSPTASTAARMRSALIPAL